MAIPHDLRWHFTRRYLALRSAGSANDGLSYARAMKPEAVKKKSKKLAADAPRPRFAPAAFLSGSPAQVQALCDELADVAAARFADLTGTTWEDVGRSLAHQLRALGHDLSSFDETPELQDWQATWHHTRGTFSLLLAFRAPCSVEVTWTTDDARFTALRG
jgi:hypothetical protein